MHLAANLRVSSGGIVPDASPKRATVPSNLVQVIDPSIVALPTESKTTSTPLPLVNSKTASEKSCSR